VITHAEKKIQARGRALVRKAQEKGVKILNHQASALYTILDALNLTDDALLPEEPMWTILSDDKRVRILSQLESPQGRFISPEEFDELRDCDMMVHVVYNFSSQHLEPKWYIPEKLDTTAEFVGRGECRKGTNFMAKVDRWYLE
jgi:hypothetical protein